MSEVTIILKDDERTYKKKFLCYNTITTSTEDPYLLSCIKEAKQDFQGEPTDIQIRITISL